MAPNLGWTDVPLGAAPRPARSAPPCRIAVANDADLGALVEQRRGVARGADDILYISGEVGVGGGMIVGGKPMTGVAGYSGEIGHMPLNPAGIAAAAGPSAAGRPRSARGRWCAAPAVRPAAAGPRSTGPARGRAGGLGRALAALDHVGRWLGIGLAALVNVLNPRVIVLGGIFGRHLPVRRRTLEAELDRRALPAPRALVRVVPATLGVDAPLLGAAELAFEPLLADPALWLGPRADLAELASA